MKLQYENLIIRQAINADAKQLSLWWNDGFVMAHAGFPKGLGLTENQVKGRIFEGLLIIEENYKPIGECYYKDKGNETAEIGIKICVASCQNRGVGRKVLSLLISFLFQKGYKKLVLDTNLNNKRAQHVYDLLGFSKVKTNINSWTDQLGVLQSSVEYELVEDNFAKTSMMQMLLLELRKPHLDGAK